MGRWPRCGSGWRPECRSAGAPREQLPPRPRNGYALRHDDARKPTLNHGVQVGWPRAPSGFPLRGGPAPPDSTASPEVAIRVKANVRALSDTAEDAGPV